MSSLVLFSFQRSLVCSLAKVKSPPVADADVAKSQALFEKLNLLGARSSDNDAISSAKLLAACNYIVLASIKVMRIRVVYLCLFSCKWGGPI